VKIIDISGTKREDIGGSKSVNLKPRAVITWKLETFIEEYMNFRRAAGLEPT
jgi:hypothetical protein